MQHMVPFFPNSPDSTRCVLACTKMVLGMLEPGTEYTWEQLDEISGKSQHRSRMLGVWHFCVLTYLAHVAQQKGSHVVVAEAFPYRAFHLLPTLTTLYFFGLRAGIWNVLLSSLRTEAYMVSAFLRAVPQKVFSQHGARETEDSFEKMISSGERGSASCRVAIVPTLDTLTQFLDHNYVCLVQLNGYVLDGEPGYGGHMVLVVGYTADTIIIHNPRLPGSPNRHYPRAVFLAAWHSPYRHCANLYAVKMVDV